MGKIKIKFVNTHLFFIHGRFERKRYGSPENHNKLLLKVYLLLTILCWNNIYWSPVLAKSCTVLEIYAMRYNITGLGRVIFHFLR